MKCKIVSILYFILFFSVNCFAFEQDFYPKENITVGDKCILSLKASGLTVDTIDRDKLKETNFGDFELLDIKPNQTGGIDLVLSAYKAGKVELLSADIFYNVNNQTQFVKTTALPIEIKSVLDPQKPSQDIQDIKGIITVSHSLSWWLKIILVVIILGIIIFLVVRYIIKHKKHKPTQEEIILAIPPREYAIQQLDELKNKNLIEKGQIKDYYDTLSDILRYYVSRVYKVDGLEKTTKELFSLLKDKMDIENNRELRNFLINCDFVKFAKVVPTQEDTQADFEQAKSFIEKV